MPAAEAVALRAELIARIARPGPIPRYEGAAAAESGPEVAERGRTMKLISLSLLALVASPLGCGSSTSSSSVSAIAVSPSPCGVGRTNSVQMSATATFPDGTKRDVTSSAAWSTSNAQTATVDPAGTVVGVNAGSTGITATYDGATGKVYCTVSP